MQKKIIQQPVPVVRKVFTTSTGAHHQTQQIQQHHQSNMQLNAVKKINSLLQSGSVSVTGISSGQQRVLQRKPITTTTPSGVLISSSSNNNSFAARQQQPKCYICGENAGLNATILSEASTTTTQTEYVVKLAKVIGPDYSVVLTVEDVICRRCIVLLNQFDKLESELETLRGTLLSFIHKKNNIPDDGPDTSSSSGLVGSPPPKMPKLQPISSAGSGGTVVTPAGNVTYSIKTIAGQQQQMVDANTSGASTDLNTSATSDVEAQLTSMFEKNSTSPGTTVKQHIVVTTNNGGTATMGESAGGGGMGVNRKGTKLYKCIPCGFKTADLAQFQPHYATCQPRNNAAAAAQQNASSVNAGATTTTTTTTTTGYRCKFCKLLFANIALLKQHNLQEHHVQTHPPQQKTIVTTTSGGVTTGQEHQQQGTTATTTTLYSCTVCNAFKTADKQSYDDHLRKHIKLKPFKCRVCLMRFESREQASIHAKQHQPDYFKCGICNVTFSKRDQLMSHLEVHESAKKNAKQPVQQQQQQEQQHQHQLQQQQQQQQQTSTSSDSSTQKLLQESIDEALRETIADSIGDSKVIQFHTCNSCSLTFLSEKLYTQHIKTHAHGTTTAPAVVTTGLALQQHQPTHQGQSQQQQQLMLSNSSTTTTGRKSMAGVNNSGAATTASDGGGGSNSKHLTTSTSTGSSGGGGNASSNTISDGDLESIFERMHSDSKGNDSSTGGGAGGDNGGNSSSSNSMVITNQDGTTGNITFNITLPQQEDGTFVQQQQQQQEHQQSVGIDMPTLDQGDDQQQPQKEQQQQLQTIPVSMPSLDDDGEQSQNSQNSNTENVPMELEDMQSGEGQQINLILNDGQVLQLDNHILTTDAEGNQILVQGTDSEQIQQLLQSVGVVMQGGEGLGEGETLQMISGDGSGNQMILVQGADGQEQLIDASLLNADGNIVIQQSQEGELNAEGTHITTEDGLQIPVSVAFTTSGEAGHEGQLTVSVADGSEQQLQLHLQQAAHAEGDEQQQQHHDESDEHHHHHQQQQQHQQQGAILTESGQIIIQSKEHDEESARVGEENGSANDSMASDGGGAADDHTNGGDTTLSSGGSNGTITTTTTTAATPGASTNAVSSSGGGGGGGGDEQLFNFDELIQPQIVVKQQVK